LLGGKWERFLMRAADIFYSIPPLLLAMLMITFFGRSPVALVLALALFGWVSEIKEIENWPGKRKLTGLKAMQDLIKQAEKFGAKLKYSSITHVDFSSHPFTLKTDEDETIKALSVIVATGANPKKLDIPGVDTYWAKGIGICTICDAPFQKGKNVAVIGGDDYAAERALQLAAYANNVYMISKKPHLDMTGSVYDYLKSHKNITIYTNSRVTEILGDGEQVTGIKFEDGNSKKPITFDVHGVFLSTGMQPNSDLFKGQLDLSEKGYIKVEGQTSKTSVPGIFAGGMIMDDRYKKAATALGDGAQAALDCIKYLQKNTDVIKKKTE